MSLGDARTRVAGLSIASVEHEGSRRSRTLYLWPEFGWEEEGNESRVSAQWPFDLHYLGTVDLSGRSTVVFEFDQNGESYFALDGRALDFMGKSGMDIRSLTAQLSGSAWIPDRQPVTLNDVRPGQSDIPSVRARRKRLDELLARWVPGGDFELDEGLFLVRTGTYLGLARDAHGSVIAFGDALHRSIPESFAGLAPWRQLALAVGIDLGEREPA